MTTEGLRAELKSELEELENLYRDFAEYTDHNSPPYEWDQLRVFAGLLHDFYNGVENIFERVVRRIDRYPEILEGEESHQALLKYVSQPVDNTRPPLISNDLRQELEEYLGFRHVVRHAYGHRFRWDRMKSLVENFPAVYSNFSEEIESFIESELPLDN